MRTRMRGMVLITLIYLLAGCVTVERPIRPRPPTGGPEDRMAWSRSLSAPDAPVALVAPESEVVNVVCVGDCVVDGGASWVTSDMRVAWTHPDPASVDYYEVFRSTTEPYFELETCERCELAVRTTALEGIVTDSPRGFNPVGGTGTAELYSTIDAYRVRACNAGGCSDLSNVIAAINESLLQGFKSMDFPR